MGGLIFLIATYVLSVDKKYTPKTFVFLPIVQWLYIKSISFFVGFAYGLIMKFYWKCNDFKGRSKVKTFFCIFAIGVCPRLLDRGGHIGELETGGNGFLLVFRCDLLSKHNLSSM